MAKKDKERFAKSSFGYRDATNTISFQMKKRSLWWLWLLLLLLLLALLLLLKGRDKSVSPEPLPPVPGTGDVQILLKWSNMNDLDISCKDPKGDVVSFQNPVVSSGGQLDIDMNAGADLSSSPIENIYWPTGGAPKGRYTVYLTYYARHDALKQVSPYEIMVKHGDKTDNYTGEMTEVGQEIQICSFTIE